MEEMAKLFSTVIYRVVGVDKGKSASGFVGSRTRVAAQDYGSNLSFKKLNAASPLAVKNRALVGPLITDSFERNPFAASSAVEIVSCVAVIERQLARQLRIAPGHFRLRLQLAIRAQSQCRIRTFGVNIPEQMDPQVLREWT